MMASESDIDEALMASVQGHWRKGARVLVLAADKLGWDSDDDFNRLARRVEVLTADRQLEAQGDLSRWRHSEVRLPECQAFRACVMPSLPAPSGLRGP